MKKFLSLLLAAMMIFSVLPTAALADGMKTLDMAPVGEAAVPVEETPAEEPANEQEQIAEQDQVAAISNDLTVLSDEKTVTIHAPTGSTVSFGTGASYSGHQFMTATSVTSDENGVTAVFALPENTDAFYRIQNPNGVTYWDFGKWRDSTEITITADDLYIGSTEYNQKTVYHNFEKNTHDVADIYLNINKEGYLALNVGDSEEIYAVRNWQAIESFFNAKIAVPDVHYEVIDVNGNPSDILTITPDENKSMFATLTANKTGTAIVLVTYDAMIHMQAEGGGTQFSAIWPENTGVFVVTVGADGTAIKTNMTINEGLNKVTGKYAVDSLDYEHDVLYYEGTDGTSYSFTPESGCTVTVMRPVLTENAMTYKGGFTSDGVSVDENGKVTISGLMHGTNIVKITKGDLSTYQLIRAKQAEVVITDSEGNVIEDGTEIVAGSEINITYNGIYNPAEKLSGIYNFTPRLFYVDEDNNLTCSSGKAGMGVYNFGYSQALRTFKYKISDFTETGTLILNGGIGISAYGQPVGGHRGKDMLDNTKPDLNAGHRTAYLGRLPEVTLNIKGRDDLIACIIKITDGTEEIEKFKYTVTNESGLNATFTSSEFKVPAGSYNMDIVADGYVTVHNFEIDVTEDGEKSFSVVLEKVKENAWDGESFTQPQQDENGVWQISNAEELYWFAKESNLGTITSQDAVLTADIDLAGHQFEAINSFTDSTFDGQGHTIYNVYRKVTADEAGGMTFGGIVNGAPDSIIKNVNVTGFIEVYTESTSPSANINIGGIVGSVHLVSNTSLDEKKPTGIFNCVSDVDIKVVSRKAVYATVSAAGVVNRCSGKIQNCINKGDIYVDVEPRAGRGAITYLYAVASGVVGSATDIENCANYGNVTVVQGGSNAAGIAGAASGTAKEIASVKNCYNVGTVTAKSKQAAGIVSNSTYATIENCYNYGKINAETYKAGKVYVASSIANIKSVNGSNKTPTVTLKNNYYLDTSVSEGVSGVSLILQYTFMALKWEAMADADGEYAAKNAEAFADGTVLALLNGEDGSIFAQRIGKVAYPEFKTVIDEAEAKEVAAVEALIEAIGTVTKDSGDAINAARKSYDALTPEQKNLVTKEAYDALVKAEKLFDMIQGSNKPGTLPGGKTDGSSSGVIKISATGAAKGEQNPNTGAEVFGE